MRLLNVRARRIAKDAPRIRLGDVPYYRARDWRREIEFWESLARETAAVKRETALATRLANARQR